MGTTLLARHAIVERVYPSEDVELAGEEYAYLNGLLVAISEAEASHQAYLNTGEVDTTTSTRLTRWQNRKADSMNET